MRALAQRRESPHTRLSYYTGCFFAAPTPLPNALIERILAASTPPPLISLQALRLDDARALLKHDAQDSRQGVDESDSAYLQRVIDGLCELSLKDPLTGLGNRRHFRAVLERSIEAVARSGDSVLLLMLDIDHFKSINDNHGHLAGDQVLQAIASCLAR